MCNNRVAVLALLALATAIGGSAVALQGVSNDDIVNQLLRPGGQYLTFDANAYATGPLVEAFDPAQRFAAGKAVYYRDWLAATDGDAPLAGPDYDATSCAACHVETAAVADLSTASFTPLIAKPATRDHLERFGPQLTTNRHGAADPEASIEVLRVDWPFVYPDGERLTLVRPVGRAFDRDGETVPVRLRAAPLLFGWGLLERVDPNMLAFFHDPDDRDGDGISGRLVGDGERFAFLGWKNSHTSLRSQIAAALANDMGVTSRHNCGAGCSDEIKPGELDALTEYVRHLGVPDRRPLDDLAGQHLFGTTGCVDCHVTVLKTRAADGGSPLAGQLVWPYSDLMLHDMGPALAEPGGAADASEWRTAPLWGLGVVETHLPQRGFLHDGRARTIEEAILWHGGEAERSKQRFVSLSASEREALLTYVRSL